MQIFVTASAFAISPTHPPLHRYNLQWQPQYPELCRYDPAAGHRLGVTSPVNHPHKAKIGPVARLRLPKTMSRSWLLVLADL